MTKIAMSDSELSARLEEIAQLQQGNYKQPEQKESGVDFRVHNNLANDFTRLAEERRDLRQHIEELREEQTQTLAALQSISNDYTELFDTVETVFEDCYDELAELDHEYDHFSGDCPLCFLRRQFPEIGPKTDSLGSNSPLEAREQYKACGHGNHYLCSVQCDCGLEYDWCQRQ